MKTRIIYTVIAVLSLLNPIKISAYVYEPMSSPSANTEFVWQSENFYQQEMNSYSYFSNSPFLTLSENSLLRLFGGDEGMTSGDGGGNDTSNNDWLYYANDVPVGDGTLPLLLAIFGWFIIVIMRQLSPFGGGRGRSLSPAGSDI